MNKLKIGNLSVKLPIIQGGMGVCVSLSGLASAVANEGGIGVISAVGIGMLELDYKKNFREANKRALKKQIRKARLKTNGIIGINIMMAITDFDDLLEVTLREQIDVVFIGAGLPLRKPAKINPLLMELTNTKIIPKVSSARAVKLIFQFWSEKYNRIPDAVVLEGPLAGGHIGFKKEEISEPGKSLQSILKETLPIIDVFEQKYGLEIPIIAGGGIYSGKDMWEIMEIGAKGVKMGTRFVTTYECDASIKFKQNYLACSPDDITVIDSPVGLPGRVITNNFVKQIQEGKQKPVNCSWKCLKTCNFRKVQFCIAEALFNAANGDFQNGFSFAGTNAYLANKIVSVKETIKQIKNEYNQVNYLGKHIL
jgi:nitronate monooxygenase